MDPCSPPICGAAQATVGFRRKDDPSLERTRAMAASERV